MSKSYLPTQVLSGLLAVLASGVVQAQSSDYDIFNDKFRLYIGGFWPEVDSKLGINADQLPEGPPIDIEDALGVEDGSGVAWGGARWNFGRKHSLEFEAFTLERSGGVSDTFNPPLQVGDAIIESGAIDTAYDTSVGRVTYGYSIIRNDRSRLTLHGGLHIASLEAQLQLSGSICTPETSPSTSPGCPPDGVRSERQDVTAPLPHLGASYSYALTPTLTAGVKAIGFALEIDGIDGSMLELDADIAWQPFRNFGVGAGIR